jgi:hypothetical protein
MKLLSLVVVCLVSVTVGAEAPAPPMDMTKMGPLARKVMQTDAKGIDALFKAMEEAWMKGDLNAVADLHDFPVYMGTDDLKGKYEGGEWTRETFLQVMAPMTHDMPKDLVTKHKLATTYLSDTLVLIIDDATMIKGKTVLGSFKTSNIAIKKNGKWLFKGGFEAGWGGMAPEPAAGASTKM